MERRFLSMLVWLPCVIAAMPATAAEADWQARLTQAATMQQDAAKRQKAADVEFDRQNIACQEKFLVNACVNKAREAHSAVSRESRQMEVEAAAIEREVKREQVQARDARVAAESEQRARELPERERSVAMERQTADLQRQQRMDAKVGKAEEGARRKSEREEAHRRKIAAHEARVAERKARAAKD